MTRKLQDQDQIAFVIDGEVKVGGLGILSTTIPIEHQGTLPLTGTLNQLHCPDLSNRLSSPAGKSQSYTNTVLLFFVLSYSYKLILYEYLCL